MRKLPSANTIADTLHRGFVWACLGLTAYGFVVGGVHFYHYMNVTRPQRQALKETLLIEDQRDSRTDSEELKS